MPSLSRLSTQQKTGKGYLKQASGSLSAKLKPGTYFISVQNGTGGTSQRVDIKSRSTVRVSIKLPGTTGVEPVTYESAQNLTADSTHLVYLGSQNSLLSQINTQNEETTTQAIYGRSAGRTPAMESAKMPPASYSSSMMARLLCCCHRG